MEATIKGKGTANVTSAATKDPRKDRFLERSRSRHEAKIKFAEPSRVEIEGSDAKCEHHFVLIQFTDSMSRDHVYCQSQASEGAEGKPDSQ